MVICCRGLEGLVAEGNWLKRQESRYFQEVQLAVAGLWDCVPCYICLHVGQCLLLLFVLDSLWCPVGASFIVARIELLII
jgi:hypothetical protein